MRHRSRTGALPLLICNELARALSNSWHSVTHRGREIDGRRREPDRSWPRVHTSYRKSQPTTINSSALDTSTFAISRRYLCPSRDPNISTKRSISTGPECLELNIGIRLNWSLKYRYRKIVVPNNATRFLSHRELMRLLNIEGKSLLKLRASSILTEYPPTPVDVYRS